MIFKTQTPLPNDPVTCFCCNFLPKNPVTAASNFLSPTNIFSLNKWPTFWKADTFIDPVSAASLVEAQLPHCFSSGRRLPAPVQKVNEHTKKSRNLQYSSTKWFRMVDCPNSVTGYLQKRKSRRTIVELKKCKIVWVVGKSMAIHPTNKRFLVWWVTNLFLSI